MLEETTGKPLDESRPNDQQVFLQAQSPVQKKVVPCMLMDLVPCELMDSLTRT